MTVFCILGTIAAIAFGWFSHKTIMVLGLKALEAEGKEITYDIQDKASHFSRRD